MGVTSLDILNLSHALKDVCEVDCHTSECLTEALRITLQSNLLRVNLMYGEQLSRECANSNNRKNGQTIVEEELPGPGGFAESVFIRDRDTPGRRPGAD